MAGIPGDIGKGKRGGYGAARSPPGSCGYLLLSRRARALVGEMPGNIEGFVFLVCESLTALGRAGCSSSAVHYEWAKKKWHLWWLEREIKGGRIGSGRGSDTRRCRS